MHNIGLFDLITLALIFFLGLKGVLNGFIKELFGLVGLIGGIFLGARFAQDLGNYIATLFDLSSGQSAFSAGGFIILFLVFWIISVLIGQLLKKLVNMSALSVIDRVFGFIMGGVKIFLVFSVITYIVFRIDIARINFGKIVGDSFMFPLFYQTGGLILSLDYKNLDYKDANDTINKLHIQ